MRISEITPYLNVSERKDFYTTHVMITVTVLLV